jgi:hypothetical protein
MQKFLVICHCLFLHTTGGLTHPPRHRPVVERDGGVRKTQVHHEGEAEPRNTTNPLFQVSNGTVVSVLLHYIRRFHPLAAAECKY